MENVEEKELPEYVKYHFENFYISKLIISLEFS